MHLRNMTQKQVADRAKGTSKMNEIQKMVRRKSTTNSPNVAKETRDYIEHFKSAKPAGP